MPQGTAPRSAVALGCLTAGQTAGSRQQARWGRAGSAKNSRESHGENRPASRWPAQHVPASPREMKATFIQCHRAEGPRAAVTHGLLKEPLWAVSQGGMGTGNVPCCFCPNLVFLEVVFPPGRTVPCAPPTAGQRFEGENASKGYPASSHLFGQNLSLLLFLVWGKISPIPPTFSEQSSSHIDICLGISEMSRPHPAEARGSWGSFPLGSGAHEAARAKFWPEVAAAENSLLPQGDPLTPPRATSPLPTYVLPAINRGRAGRRLFSL